MTNNDLYFMYDNFVLNDVFIITSIDKTLLPGRTYNTVNIPTIDGERLNGVKYTPIVYTIGILVEGKDEEDRNLKKRILRDLLNKKHEVPVAFNTRTFGYGMVTSEVKLVNRTKTQATATFQLTCFTPFFYSKQPHMFTNQGNTLQVQNDGGEKTKPFMSVTFTQDAQFCQVENMRTNEIVLVGNYPSIESQQTFKETERIAHTECQSTNGWAQSSASIDSGRTVGGTISVASGGKGLVLGSIPSGSTMWKGACYRYNLNTTLEEFTVECDMTFTTSGTNGDPTNKSYSLNEETIQSGSRTTYYQVTASTLNVRSGPGTTHSVLTTLPNGHKITNGTLNNGWLQFEINGKTGYCSEKYLTTKVEDSTSTVNLQNWVVTNKNGAALCSSPKWGTNNSYSTQITRIPQGTVVRLVSSVPYEEKWTDSSGKAQHRTWYRLYIAYNGQLGYVSGADCTRADKATIQYDESVILNTADDKSGLIEVYGFDTAGAKLFQMVVADWNDFYEATIPRLVIGKNVVLGSNGHEIPAPKTIVSTSSDLTNGTGTVSTKYVLSGTYGNWNDCNCTFKVSRRDIGGKYGWTASLHRIDGGVITKQSQIKDSPNADMSQANLAYIVLYIGTKGTKEKCADMSLNRMTVYKHNQPENNTDTGIYFSEGDILDIDFDNRQVYINEQSANHLVDIGSRFFDIDPGITELKIITNDKEAWSTVVFREKWVGDE